MATAAKKTAARTRVRATADPRQDGAGAAPAAAPAKAVNPMAPPGASEQDHDVMANSTTGEGANKPLRERRKVEDLVSVTVPKGFRLTDDNNVVHEYESGVQDMPRSHADHWYSAANGVTKNED